MNIIVFTITLIVGCFGQQVTPPRAPGSPHLPNGLTQLPNGLPQPLNGLPQLTNGLAQLPIGLTQLPNGVTQLLNGLPQLPNGLPQLPNGLPQLPNQLAQLLNGLPQLPYGVPQLPNGLPQLPNGVPQLPNGLPQLPNGLPQLPNGVPQLPNGLPQLPNGLPQLPNGLPQLPNGPPQLPNVTLPNLPSLPAILITAASEVFERPCRPSDLTCIRRYFLHHSQCQPALGTVPDPLVRPIADRFYPSVNITQTNHNTVYRGFNNGRIQEFYINRDTDKVVLGIDLRDLQSSIKEVFFRYHRRGREPIITHGSANVIFRSLYLTVTIPQMDNLRLDKSDSYVYVNELPVPNFEPSLGRSSDPSVPAAFAALQADLPTIAAEYFLTESSFLAATYIQYVICNFGLQVI